MSFPNYQKYKSSGVERLGDVPEHWDVLPCRAIVHEQTAKNEGARCTDYLSLMANVGIIPYAKKGDIGNKKPEDVSKCKIVARGDFVINSMNYGIGSYGLSDYDGVCSPVYIVLKPLNDVVESRFAFRIFENRAFQTYAQSFGNGILEHRCSINWDILKSICVGVPPKEEQQAILEFLDRETAKIDVLVAEQRRLMELLKEKRQAVISHAVTKGLNRNVAMKSSGIEWLGAVPEHWTVTRVRYAAEGLDHLRVPIEVAERGDRRGEYPYYGASGIIDTIDGYLFDEPLVLVCEDGWNLILRTQPVARPVAGKIWVNNHAHILRPTKGNCELLAAAIELTPFEAFVSGMRQPKLTVEMLKDLPVALPPDAAEQNAIRDFILSASKEFDALTAEAQHAIDLLQERRTTLISAAVTGQIDVRPSLKNEAA